MNIQHSSRSDAWGTPVEILDSVRKVLGGWITLDPASSSEFNARVQASSYFTEEDDALSIQEWPIVRSIYLNPPGGKIKNKSKTALFWDHLLRQRFGHAIFMAFSLEALQTTQASVSSIGAFPFCVPKRRVAFVSPSGEVGAAPSHSNAIVYVPQSIDRRYTFADEFSKFGQVIGV